MRPIDADILQSDAEYFIGKMMMFGGEEIYTQTTINKAPTLDVKPVVRGRWVEFETDTPPRRNGCSECGYITNPWLAHVYNFCPNCGADMRAQETASPSNEKSRGDRIQDVLRFYSLATQLKDKIRTGWDENHWNISKERLESVAEHIYGTCILAIAMESEFQPNIDLGKVLKMLVLHEIGEVLIGDITPFDNVTPEEKARIEHEAMKDMLGDLIRADEYYSLLMEFDNQSSEEGKFAFRCDKMEADLQSKRYQDAGCHHSLDDQKFNVTWKSGYIQKCMEQGADSPFDIWAMWDRPKMDGDKNFCDVLNAAKRFNIQTVKTKE